MYTFDLMSLKNGVFPFQPEAMNKPLKNAFSS